MLDVNLFLADKGGDPEKVRESQRRRGAPVAAVDAVVALYDEWRKGGVGGVALLHLLLSPSPSPFLSCLALRRADFLFFFLFPQARFALDELNTRKNAAQKEIAKRMKAKEDASDLLAQKKEIEDQAADLGTTIRERDAALKDALADIGNIVHDSVPVSNDEVGAEGGSRAVAVGRNSAGSGEGEGRPAGSPSQAT
ncbi:MAG: hypothetical protein BJ554DRAFT_4890 [Olpidium bornovanus]|uniref:Serine-tRNA synthetase type1 N-terminal domain-containing protein n=1 Tax=Olpidium bornovanus TaxID=278681 RepID=A0A8H7ZMG7_9FUNG|nr:MAG: hypothetical protein BJ554DRAFT_4890 [Olpidium bornovanus]